MKTDRNQDYPSRAKRPFIDDPTPWLDTVGGLRTEAMGLQPTANETIEANLRLILSRVRKHPRKSDAFQEGVLGILRSFERFEKEKGTAFSTYAIYWIRSRVQRMQDENFPFHVPEGLKQIVWGFRRKKNPIALELSDAEIAKRHNFTEGAVRNARRMNRVKFLPVHDLVPVNERIPTDTSLTRDEWVERHDALTDGAPTPEDVLAETDANETVRRSLMILTQRERDVIRWRFGFDGEEESLEDIGRRLGLTRERVRQIEIKAIRTLRYAAELNEEYCGTTDSQASWSHSQHECVSLLRALVLATRHFHESGHVPNALVEAVVAYFFRSPVRNVLMELERSGILARAPDRSGWRAARGIETFGPPAGTPARFVPTEAGNRLAAHWECGVRAFEEHHFWQNPTDLADELAVAEIETRIAAIARRERLILALLPHLESGALRKRRAALAYEAHHLAAEREALSRALASHQP